MFMNKIPVLIFLSLILLVSCSKIALNDRVDATEKIILTPSPNQSPSPATVKPLMMDRFKEVVYLGVLRHMYYKTSEAFDDINGSAWMIWRQETILPEQIEEIENNPSVPAELIQSLKAENDNTEILAKYSGDEELIVSSSGDRDLSKFFEQSKRKFTKFSGTQKVAAFSRIGISADHEKALVYAEYYSVKKNLIKCYFVMDVEMYKPNSGADQAAQVWNVKMIPVD